MWGMDSECQTSGSESESETCNVNARFGKQGVLVSLGQWYSKYSTSICMGGTMAQITNAVLPRPAINEEVDMSTRKGGACLYTSCLFFVFFVLWFFRVSIFFVFVFFIFYFLFIKSADDNEGTVSTRGDRRLYNFRAGGRGADCWTCLSASFLERRTCLYILDFFFEFQ